MQHHPTADWCQVTPDGCRLQLYIQPGAKTSEVVGTHFIEPHHLRLKIRLAAAPVDGKANSALLSFLSKALQLPKQQLTLSKGDTQRFKVVDITNANIEAVRQALNLLLSKNLS